MSVTRFYNEPCKAQHKIRRIRKPQEDSTSSSSWCSLRCQIHFLLWKNAEHHWNFYLLQGTGRFFTVFFLIIRIINSKIEIKLTRLAGSM